MGQQNLTLWRRRHCVGHAIGDFYAHTFYGEFATRNGHSFRPLLDPRHPNNAKPPREYNFKPHCPLTDRPAGITPGAAAARWEGRLISGQWLRWYVPFPDDLERAKNFQDRRCLPDHDAVAVDGPGAKPGHKLYTTKGQYSRQYVARRRAASEHIRDAYEIWSGKGTRRSSGTR